ncbi:MAG: cold shock domain-containing protein [Oleiphilaceae bacterium]|nr:cold shock domain-containing protein [Oleiphilaceae bacterium]
MPQGKVKWFNNAKGYGFIIEDGGSEDLFAHFSSIQMDGYKTLKAGQQVTFEKQPSGKGIHAVNICALETNTPDGSELNCLDDEIISVEEEQVQARQEEAQVSAQKAGKVAAY